MHRYRHASSALTLLVLWAGTSLLQLSTSSPITTPSLNDSPHSAASPLAAGEGPRRVEERGSVRKGGVGMEGEEEEEDELFKDMDPKMLAAILLEALNKPRVTERRREWEGDEGTLEEGEGERGEVVKEEEQRGEEVRAAERESQDRDRDGRQELEMVMAAAAAQGKEEREREEEEDRKKAQEEEERLTEKVTSRTTSQTVPVKAEQQSTAPNGTGGGEQGMRKGVGAAQGAITQQGQTSHTDDPQQEGEQQNDDEEEEQLSPEELKNLEKMMEEFQSYNTANKRERDSQQGQRESRGYSSYNDILPASKGYDLPVSKKKLKWQEETQKGMNLPTFRGGYFMDDFDGNTFNNGGSNRAQPPLPPPAENDVMEEDEPEAEGEDEEEEEEELSPEEEEAQAKAEQEELRRQAAEVQRAKIEEEKLADIASDMLLQYMVKQNAGRKYKERKYSSSLSNAAEDKRSDEEQEIMEEDDDIDPETIDKLIEISSKLHLPADDVVDIISDVEKKKKKDVPPESLSPWQRPLVPLPSSFSSSTNDISTSQFSSNRNANGFPSSKQAPPSPAVNPLKAWFQEKTPSKSLLASQDLWMKPQKPLSANQDLWLKPQKSFRTSYPPYSRYPSYYQQKPYRGYYPIYFPPPPKPKPRYYAPKSSLALNNLLGNSANYDYNFPPNRRFRNWVQSRQRKPPASLRRNPYYGNYVLSPGPYSRTFNPVPIPKPRSLPRLASAPPRRGQYYYSRPGPLVTRDEDYYNDQIRNRVVGDNSNGDDDLVNYLTQILMKQPRRFQ